MTTLLEATLAGNPETIRVLLEYGADPLLRNKKGTTALDFASGEIGKLVGKAMKERGRSKRSS